MFSWIDDLNGHTTATHCSSWPCIVGPNSSRQPSRERRKQNKSPTERNFDSPGLHLIRAGKVGLLHGRNREELYWGYHCSWQWKVLLGRSACRMVSAASCIHVMVVPSGPKRGCSEIWPSFWNYCSKAKTTMGAQQWKNAEDSLFSLGKGNVESVDSIVRYQNRNWHGW